MALQYDPSRGFYDDAGLGSNSAPVAQASDTAQKIGGGIGRRFSGAQQQGDEGVGSSFVRGAKGSMLGLKQAAYGVAGFAGDAVGSDSLRDFGREGAADTQEQMDEQSRDSDSFSSAFIDNNGSKANWAAYWAGYAVSELAQAAVTGGVGSAIAKTAARKGVVALTEKAIQKQAGELAAKVAGQGATEEEIAKIAANDQIRQRAVQDTMGKMGFTIGMGAQNYGKELGSIYTDAVQEGEQNVDLTKIAAGAFMAAALDTISDSSAIEKIAHGVGKGGLRGAARGAASQGVIEGLTEFGQQAFERWGAGKTSAADVATGKDIASNWREYVDALAAGALGGGMIGGVGGMRAHHEALPSKPTDDTQQTLDAANTLQTAPPVTTTAPGTPSIPLDEKSKALHDRGVYAIQDRSPVAQQLAAANNDSMEAGRAANDDTNEGPIQTAGGTDEIERIQRDGMAALRQPQADFERVRAEQDRAESEAPRPTEPGSLPVEQLASQARGAVPEAPVHAFPFKALGDDPVGTMVRIIAPSSPLNNQVGVITSAQHVWVGGSNFVIPEKAKFVAPTQAESRFVPQEWRRFTPEEMASMFPQKQAAPEQTPAAPAPQQQEQAQHQAPQSDFDVLSFQPTPVRDKKKNGDGDSPHPELVGKMRDLLSRDRAAAFAKLDEYSNKYGSFSRDRLQKEMFGLSRDAEIAPASERLINAGESKIVTMNDGTAWLYHKTGKKWTPSTRYHSTEEAESSLGVSAHEQSNASASTLTGGEPLAELTPQEVSSAWEPYKTLFADPEAKVRLDDKVRQYVAGHGWMSKKEAAATIEGWKKHAQSQMKSHGSENSQKVVLSLFDYTGAWAKPWAEAGYTVLTFDIQNSTEEDIRNFSAEYFSNFGDFDGNDVHAILAAVPCTEFASSGARHFAAKDADGRTKEAIHLVEQTLATIEYFKPAVWAIENPVGRIEKLGNLPPWRLSFNPNAVGHPYTKKTLLWGRFNADFPIAPVEPTEGSKMHSMFGGKSQRTKNARSETPEGFAYSFFMANNYADHRASSLANIYDRLDPKLLNGAVAAGASESEIKHVIDDAYYQDLDDKLAERELRELIDAKKNGRKSKFEEEFGRSDEVAPPKQRVKSAAEDAVVTADDLVSSPEDEVPVQEGPKPEKLPGKVQAVMEGESPEGEQRRAEFRVNRGRLEGVAIYKGDELIEFIRARKGDTIKAMSSRLRDRIIPQQEVDAKAKSKKIAEEKAHGKKQAASNAKLEMLKEKLTGEEANVTPEERRASELTENTKSKKNDKELAKQIKEITDRVISEQDRVNAVMTEKYGLDPKSFEFVESDDPLTKAKASNIERIFPVKVQFVKPLNERADDLAEGFFLKDVSDSTVYVSTNTQNPFLFVAGHELAHSIKQRKPKLWSEFVARLFDERLRIDPEFDRRVKAMEDSIRAQKRQLGQKQPGQRELRAIVVEELHADLVGSMLMRPHFLERLAAMAKPETRTIIQKVLDLLREYLSTLKTKIADKGLRGGRAFKDVVDTERAVADLLNKFAGLNDTTPAEIKRQAVEFWSGKGESDIQFNDLSKTLQERWVDTYDLYREGDIDAAKLMSEIDDIEKRHADTVRNQQRAQARTEESEEPKLSPKGDDQLDLDFTHKAGVNKVAANQNKGFKTPDGFGWAGVYAVDDGHEVAHFNGAVEAKQYAQKVGGIFINHLTGEAGEVKNGRVASDGRNPQTQTEAFKKWFGDSKIVSNGAPKVMYHGTARDITRFEPKQAQAIFVTEDPTFAESFAGSSSNWMANHYDQFLSPKEITEAKLEAIAAVNEQQDLNDQQKEALAFSITDGTPGNDWLMRAIRKRLPSGENLMPVYVKAENPFNFSNPVDVDKVVSKLAEQAPQGYDESPQYRAQWGESFRDGLRRGLWNAIEGATVQKAIKAAGFDGFYVLEAGRKNLAVYKPNQIKSAIGNNGQFNPNEDAIMLSRKASVDDGGNAKLGEALRKVGMNREQTTTLDRIQAIAKRARAEWVQGTLDRFKSIKNLDLYSYVLARMSDSSDGALTAMLAHGKVFIDSDGALNVDHSKGLLSVLEQLGGEHDRFLAWIAGNRAARLKGEDRENNLSDDHIKELQKLNEGKMTDGRNRAAVYVKVLGEMRQFNSSVLDVAVKTGLLSQQDAEKFKADAFYVPFYRELDEGDGFEGPKKVASLVNQRAFHRLKGQDKATNDLLENVLMNWSHLLSASLKNQAAVETMNSAVGAGAAKRVTSDFKGDSVKVMVNGSAQHYAVEDPLLLSSLRALTPSGMGWATKALAKTKVWFTKGVTISPAFKVRNLIRDSIQSMALAPMNMNPLSNVGQGFKLTGNDEFMADMFAGGGAFKFGTFSEGSRADLVDRLVRQGVDHASIFDVNSPGKLLDYMKGKLEQYQEFGDRFENANRAALYKRLRDQGVSHLESSFMARDLMDFSLTGAWPWMRFLTSVVPFLNARLQGLYKLGRSYKDDPTRAGAVTAAVLGASLLAYLTWKDDDDFQQREQWDRDNFWWWKVGDTAIRIPKPFEIGGIASIFERAVEQMVDKNAEGQQFASSLANILLDNFAFNPTPQIIKPLLDVYADRDPFTGRDIEGQSMERLPKEERFNERTSLVARGVGQLTSVNGGGLSPAQIDYILRGYFGWAGGFALDAASTVLRPVAGVAEPAEAKQIMGVPEPVFLKFAQSLPIDQSRYLTAFYQQHKELQQLETLVEQLQKSGDERAEKIVEGNEDKLATAKVYDSVARQLTEINGQVKRVSASKDMTPAEKREALNELYAVRNELAKQAETERVAAAR
jgi:hypothetical protein